MFDLYTYPLSVRNNLEYSDIPGYLVGTPTKRPARTRETDILVVKFSPYRNLDEKENSILSDYLSRTSQFFFKANGPITTVSKQCGEILNDLLLKYNQSKNISEIISGSFQFIVLHDKFAYFTHCGNASTFVVSKIQSLQFDEKISGSQGLGISKALKFKIFHAELTSGDRIVISNKSPSEWTIETLTEDPRVSISHLRKTLLQRANQDFDAVILQVRTGSGAIHELKLDNQTIVSKTGTEFLDNPTIPGIENIDKAEPEFKVSEGVKEITSDPKISIEPNLSEQQIVDQIPLPPFLESTPSKTPSFEPVKIEQIGKNFIDGRSINRKTPIQNPVGKTEILNQEKLANGITENEAFESIKEPARPLFDRTKFVLSLNSIKNFLVNITNKSNKINDSISENTAKFISRTNPASKDSGSSLSPTSMFFIALLIPIMVVAISMTVYFRSGRGEQHEQFVFQANDLVKLANSESDFTKRVVIFQDALLYLDEAEKYGKTETSDELRSIIQTELDSLQGVTRLNLQGTVAGGIDRRMQISKLLVNSGEDLYALDQGTGRVLRMVFANNDFQVDTTFICGPGNYDQVIVHELVDIEPISVSNSLQAVLIGIDRSGRLLLCSNNNPPVAFNINPPEMGWGDIKAIAFNDISVYILDVNERTRDLYRLPSNGLKFDANPESIFSGNIPESLLNVKDMAIYQTELFLLQDSDEITKCTIGQAQVNCVPNVGYGLILEGQNRQVSDVIPGVDITQVQITQPPDPSIFFMDGLNSAVYHYSLALNMQKQIKPNFIGSSTTPEGPLTAFTVSPYGLIHFAFGYQLYFGYLP